MAETWYWRLVCHYSQLINILCSTFLCAAVRFQIRDSGLEGNGILCLLESAHYFRLEHFNFGRFLCVDDDFYRKCNFPQCLSMFIKILSFKLLIFLTVWVPIRRIYEIIWLLSGIVCDAWTQSIQFTHRNDYNNVKTLYDLHHTIISISIHCFCRHSPYQTVG